MSKLRRQHSANTPSVVETKNLIDIKAKTGNVYESISIVAKRANQINVSLKEELLKLIDLTNSLLLLSKLANERKGVTALAEVRIDEVLFLYRIRKNSRSRMVDSLKLLDNFVSTPHVGGSSDEAIMSMGLSAIDNLYGLLKGRA